MLQISQPPVGSVVLATRVEPVQHTPGFFLGHEHQSRLVCRPGLLHFGHEVGVAVAGEVLRFRVDRHEHQPQQTCVGAAVVGWRRAFGIATGVILVALAANEVELRPLGLVGFHAHQVLVRAAIERRLFAGQVKGRGRFLVRIVTEDTVLVPDGLDQLFVVIEDPARLVSGLRSGHRRFAFRRRGLQGNGGGFVGRKVTPDAPAGFTRLVLEGIWLTLNGHVVLVEHLERDVAAGGHVEAGRAVLFDRHDTVLSHDAAASARQTRHGLFVIFVSLAGHGWARNAFQNADELHVTALDAIQSRVHVSQHTLRRLLRRERRVRRRLGGSAVIAAPEAIGFEGHGESRECAHKTTGKRRHGHGIDRQRRGFHERPFG